MQSTGGEVKAVNLWMRAAGQLKRLGLGVLDQLYPPICLSCGAPVAVPDTLCALCWRELRPITVPLCPRLGIPFEVDLGPGALSAEAIADPPPFWRARAAFQYNDMARKLAGTLKYRDRPELARFAGRAMAAAGAELLAGEPLVVPVPLYRWRQWQRRYNQSAELARVLAALGGLDIDLHLVRRTRQTRQQVGLNAGQRARNVAGAFAVHPDGLARVGGRRVVLVDDVLTTGATARAVTRALTRAGAIKIDIVTFARVVFGRDDP